MLVINCIVTHNLDVKEITMLAINCTAMHNLDPQNNYSASHKLYSRAYLEPNINTVLAINCTKVNKRNQKQLQCNP